VKIDEAVSVLPCVSIALIESVVTPAVVGELMSDPLRAQLAVEVELKLSYE
jgi:hypothetical protein